MTSDFGLLQRRFGTSRPGLALLAVEDAALPVTMLRADVLAQEKKKLPVTDEFLLRFTALGVSTPSSIAAYLGLETSHIVDAAAAQVGEDHLRRGDGDHLKLTAQGLEVVRNLVATQPVEQQLPIAFDRLAWTVANYPERALIEKREAEELGMLILPAERNASIQRSDVPASDLNGLLRDDRLQVLRVHRVSTRKHRYLPVRLLIFGDVARNELELAMCIDDDLSDAHGSALAGIGVASKLRLALGEHEGRPILEPDLEALRSADAATERLAVPLSGTVRVSTSEVRSVSVFEHADLLSEALETAKRRILVISPWVRAAVVTREFAAKLEQRLREGVKVTIGYGIGGDDSDSDQPALERLRKLATRHKNFDLARLKSTHAKILVFDDKWISTSFNWLSFRGSPTRTYRMEEGTLVTVKERVDKEYERYIAIIDEQRR